MILVLSIVWLVYRLATVWEKQIVVGNKYVTSVGRYSKQYMLNSSSYEVYQIGNDLLTFDFTAPERYASISNGEGYKVRGYGVRVPILGLYPNILQATNP